MKVPSFNHALEEFSYRDNRNSSLITINDLHGLQIKDAFKSGSMHDTSWSSFSAIIFDAPDALGIVLPDAVLAAQ
jgi:hypothetical protein